MRTTLNQYWKLWIEKARELESENIGSCAPLFSAKPSGFDQHANRVLLVGKATAGWYWKDGNGLRSRLSDAELALRQVETNLDFREGRVDEGAANRGFWNFAIRIGKALGDSSPSPRNVIWSNLFKIGGNCGNPTPKSAERQKDLAVETLRREIQVYKPSLVIFTTLGFHDPLVYRVAGLQHKHDWVGENEKNPDESWTLKSTKLPPILWTRHPAFKSRKTIEKWIEKAVSL